MVGLLALLDDVVALTKVAAASLDDVASQVVQASGTAAGVVIDDTAVTPRYVVGFAAERELPIVRRIARGSLKNKILFLLPVALLLSAFAPWAITPLLMIGGVFLCFEGFEKVHQMLASHDPHANASHAESDAVDPGAVEEQKVAGAIRTDFILSAEIMAIALASLGHLDLMTTAFALIAVALAITAGVYGVVALIVKLDDIGLHMAARQSRLSRAIGEGLVKVVPKLLSMLSAIGTAAMLWVGGGIILHGLEVMHLADGIPHAVHDLAQHLGMSAGPLSGFVAWLVTALAGAVAGLVVGGIIAAIVRRFVKHPEELIVD